MSFKLYFLNCWRGYNGKLARRKRLKLRVILRMLLEQSVLKYPAAFPTYLIFEEKSSHLRFIEWYTSRQQTPQLLPRFH